jgi:hypothetical protein
MQALFLNDTIEIRKFVVLASCSVVGSLSFIKLIMYLKLIRMAYQSAWLNTCWQFQQQIKFVYLA